MNRQLNKDEKKLTEDGISRLQKEIKELQESLIVFKAREEYLNAKWKYEELAFPYQKKIEKDEAEKMIKQAIEELHVKKHSISEMEKHIKYGVEPKREDKTYTG